MEKESKYNKRVDAPPGMILGFGVDTCGAVGPNLAQYLEEADRALAMSRRARWSPAILSNESPTPTGELRKAKELISLAVCRANGEFFELPGRASSGMD